MKGTDNMKIAVTYENGQIFQHFGRTEQFKFYEVEGGKVISEQVLGTNGAGHGALAGFLKVMGADVLICGGIGGGAQMALKEAGIALFGGNSGSADDAVAAYLANALVQNESPTCGHHSHDHGTDHSCGHKCGE
ncbi:MAG: dinitrogenase iron-molybdenum cofactor biosynthesis protein [Ruminococcus albus]|nr:dinitrogenase iron-molybdenum cofactor biosynthesis protein [Ruminococcus albus]